jgi:BRCT domain type II-containing protein
MKKLLFVLAIVAVYGFSISTASANVVIAEKAEISIVADDNITPEGEKETKKASKAKTQKAEAKGAACGDAGSKSETKAGCGEAEKKACGTAAKACGDKK